ncbi:acetyl-CoA C-acetyltransferase, partial [Phenoliferia sp. Uapishka_3]
MAVLTRPTASSFKAASRLAHIRMVRPTVPFPRKGVPTDRVLRSISRPRTLLQTFPQSSSLELQNPLQARTPVGSFQGVFSKVSAVQLGVAAVKGVLAQSGLKADHIEDVYFGNVLQGGVGQSPARQVALGAGCPDTTEATTVNKVCASGMKAVMLASQNIQTGQRGVMVAGGMESMSNAPFYYPRVPATFGNVTAMDAIVKDGLTDVYNDFAMGNCAEKTAKDHSITREAQDAFALESYRRAAEAWSAGAFTAEIAPVTIADARKGDTVVKEDEEYKKILPAKVPSLRPVFQKTGTVTAANASNLNDGASAIILASAEKVEELGLKPLAKVISFADAACSPIDFPIAPAHAIPLALKKAGLTIADIARFEINEAFSAVALANQQILGIDAAKLNVNGGAVALTSAIRPQVLDTLLGAFNHSKLKKSPLADGFPGPARRSSGSRIIVTLVHQLKPNEYGVAAVCNGGGGASAIVIQGL